MVRIEGHDNTYLSLFCDAGCGGDPRGVYAAGHGAYGYTHARAADRDADGYTDPGDLLGRAGCAV
jgi:hypothetical protein